MAITTYAELQTAVAGWLNRTDLTARIPEFIAIAEAKINRKLRTMEQFTAADVSIIAEYLDLPADWAQTANLAHDDSDGGEIEYVTPQRFVQMKRNYSPSGKPRYYTLEGARMRFAPVPDSPHPAVHSYYKLVPPLTALAPTNWLLTGHPDAYLSASLQAANTYLRDTEGMAIATAEFADALAAIEMADEIDKTSTTPIMRACPI